MSSNVVLGSNLYKESAEEWKRVLGENEISAELEEADDEWKVLVSNEDFEEADRIISEEVGDLFKMGPSFGDEEEPPELRPEL